MQPVSFIFLTSLSMFAVKKWTSVAISGSPNFEQRDQSIVMENLLWAMACKHLYQI